MMESHTGLELQYEFSNKKKNDMTKNVPMLKCNTCLQEFLYVKLIKCDHMYFALHVNNLYE